MIRRVKPSDADEICTIYNNYIRNSTVTFEEKPLTGDDFISRINNVCPDYPWFVSEEDGKVIGYIYADKWKGRSAYRYTVEFAVYIASTHAGRGTGTILMEALIGDLKERSIHSVIGGIALPNPASIALCEKFGFKKVAHFREAGKKFGAWIDVGYWQRIL